METYEEEIVREASSVKDTRKRHILWIIGLVFVVSLLGGGIAALFTYSTLKGAAEDGTVLAQQIQKECEKPGITDPDLAQFCPKADEVVEKAPETVKAEQIPGPEGPAGDTGAQGETGATGPAPSRAQVQSAVRRFCLDTGRCDGQRGNNATPAQVAIAVSSYCNSRGECRGEQGENGNDGADGLNGRDAPPVTQAQLIQAVEAFCADGNCRGPAGADGTDGDDGNTGPQGPSGIAQVTDLCEAAPTGQVIDDVISSYDANTQAVVIDCTYRDISPIPSIESESP